MHRHPFHPTVEFVAVVMLVTAWAVPCAAQTEIDVFMERVLDRREENWITLRQYVLDEREVFEVRGPDRVPFAEYAPGIYVVRARRLPDPEPRAAQRRDGR